MCKNLADGGKRCPGRVRAELDKARALLAGKVEQIDGVNDSDLLGAQMDRFQRARAKLTIRVARLEDEWARTPAGATGQPAQGAPGTPDLASARPGHRLGPEQVLRLGRVWHVGTFDPSLKSTASYEGQGLSVSLHPEEWSQIARLGGSTWELRRQPGTFLDAHAMTKQQRTAVRDWAIEEGLVEPAVAWKVTWWDDEDDREVSMLMSDQDEARAEAEDREADPPVAVETTVATARLAKIDSTARAGETDPDAVLPLYAELGPHGLDFDGVWWADDYDPSVLSCPRGVVSPSKVNRWARTAGGPS